ncbi:ashwin-like [Lineus longissimus]|uniref:ashwin-like n=1 Tax=Lineus longissimus TaxID=88925 RepID=UPI00315CD035
MAVCVEHDFRETIDLLHPEILSEEGLLELFRRRHVPVSIKQSQSKNELVQLYYKTIIPMPQRTYRNNRRGKLMRRSQELIDERNKRPKEEEADHLKTCFPSSLGSSRTPPGPSTPLLDRLKSPPEKTAVKGVVSLKAKPYGIGQEKTDNPLDSVVIKTLKRKHTAGDEVSKDNSRTTDATPQPIKIRKKILRVTEQKIDDPLDKIVIKTFVKKMPADATNSDNGVKRLSADNESEQTLTKNHENPGLKTAIDSINKHLNVAESSKGTKVTLEIGAVKEDCDKMLMETSLSLGKRPLEGSTADQSSHPASSSSTPPVKKKRKIKINRTSV